MSGSARGVRSNAHSYRNWGEGLGNDPSYPARVRLSASERRELQAIVDGTGAAWRRRAQILRMADEGHDGGNLRDVDSARGLGIGASTVERLRKRCVLEGLEASLRRREQENRRPKLLDGAKEAKLVALAGSSPPEGCVRWTLKLLAGRRMEREIVESISKETVRRTLKKRYLLTPPTDDKDRSASCQPEHAPPVLGRERVKGARENAGSAPVRKNDSS